MRAPAFDCAQCGRRIGATSSHHILKDGRVVCMRHYEEHADAGNIAHGFCTRTAAARLLGVLPECIISQEKRDRWAHLIEGGAS